MRRYVTTTVLVFGAVEPQDIAALQRRCGIMRRYVTTTVLVVGAVEPQDIAALQPTTHYPLTPPNHSQTQTNRP